MIPRRALAPVLGATAVALLAACSGAPADTPVPTRTPTPSATANPPAAQSCSNRLQSYAPLAPQPQPGAMPAGSTMAAIAERGRLIAGVSADSYLLGSRNPLTGAVEGFDIDMVNAVARAILGPKARVELKVITAGQRLPVLKDREVDIVVRNMTITCDRWKEIAFSAEYYKAGQKLLVRRGSGITGMGDLAGRRVCAPAGTTSMDNLIRLAPKAVPVPARNHTGCLVALQQGEADAITGDDTVLAGLAAQDPYAEVLDGRAVTEEPYGIGVNAGQVDLVRFVNGVLERMRADGSWQRSFDRWLAPTLGAEAGVQPRPQYGRG